MQIRKATYKDIDALMKVFAYARKQMARDGNPMQWGDGYPEKEQIEEDIERGVGYVLEEDGELCGCFVFIVGNDPTYELIEGAWLDDKLAYGTIHRIASNGKKKGIFNCVLEWCTKECANIRIDTHKDNARMIHLIKKAGFTECGIIYTRNHSARKAYQKKVQ